MRRTKGSATKTPVLCPNIIKMYNASMGGVDVIDQKTAAFRLDRKSKFRFYLRMFFDFINISIVNSHIVYTKLCNSITCLISKLLLQNRWLEGIPIGNDLFLWAEQASEKPWSLHCQRKYQNTCRNSTRSSCDAISAKRKEVTMKHLYLVRPVVFTCAVPKREIAF